MNTWRRSGYSEDVAHSQLEGEINTRLAGAERLLASASRVGDAADHRFWRASRDLWAESTARGLRLADVDEGFASTFTRAVTPPAGEGSVTEDLPVDLEGVRHGMALLIGLRARGTSAETRTSREERRVPRHGP
jgi:hypothetical protein